MTQTPLAYSVLAIANAFIDAAKKHCKNKKLTHVHLHKLVLISQGFALALLDRPMYRNQTEAWRHGPIIPDLYHALKHQNATYVKKINTDEFVNETSPESDIIQIIAEAFGDTDELELSSMIYQEKTPWAAAHKNGDIIIDNELTKQKFLACMPEELKRQSTNG